METPYDSVLLLSFGGPECRADVLPFLANVLRGRNVPHQRMLEVAEHYYHFDGRSPINDQNRALLAALREELGRRGVNLPVYWGNRNWHPLLADTLREMAAAGCRRALVFITSAFGSYSGCRQYLNDIERARGEVGPEAPRVDKLRPYALHPLFISATVERLREAFDRIAPNLRATAPLIFTAHSIPLAMAETSPYEGELREAARRVAAPLGRHDWHLAFQSRSGPPQQKWLEPDIGDLLRSLAGQHPGATVVLVPLGFISDHMEVMYDLDTEAQDLCRDLGLAYVRAATVGVHAHFVQMAGELIVERVTGAAGLAECDSKCCAYDPRPPGAASR